MSTLRNLLHHSMSYFTGRIAILLAGLISLPVTTRLLTKEDYGLMSLIFLAITISTSICTLGFQQATTRYFAEYASRGKIALLHYCSTMTFGAVVSGTIAMLVVFVISIGLVTTQSFADMAVHLKYAVVLILVRPVASIFLQIFRGNQQTFAYNLISVISRYLTIGVIILLIVYVYHDVTAVFVGTIIVETAILLITAFYLFRRKLIGWVRPESPTIKRAIRFGVPLVIADLMVSLVASSDRFVIQYFLDADSVAIYSVGYDISDYVATMFATPLQLAILPIVYKLWSEEGEESTRKFLNNAINMSFMIVIPMIAGFSVVGPDIVTTLASDKYAAAGDLVPYVSFGVILGSMNFLLFTGLLLREKTRIITILNGAAAIANLALNIVLVPMFGIIGAAYATIISYLMLNSITYIVSGRHLQMQIDWIMIIKAVAAAIGMVMIIQMLNDVTGVKGVDALIRTLVGAGLYFTTMYLIEPKFRSYANAFVAKFSKGIGRPEAKDERR